jgi:hypothetical protein
MKINCIGRCAAIFSGESETLNNQQLGKIDCLLSLNVRTANLLMRAHDGALYVSRQRLITGGFKSLTTH